ncbi:MAG: rhodanese-like domain-containing protein [Ignavibacteria bacterium]|nr:rhodanese-like domain-containing protein [Ignavibacteria bacterium]
MQFLKKFFGLGPKADFKELFNNGATIVDVRTKSEYHSGNIKGSLNIPLDILPNSLSKINRDKPVITCCASGMRSASAKRILKNNGYTEVYNGGGWTNLLMKIRD